MNKTESEYDALFLGRRPHGYEEITLRLGDDCRYTPDFWVLGDDDVIEFHEVKGGFIRDDARAKLRIAAERYPHFRFYLMQKTKLGWSRAPVGPEDAAA
jgi:hypothetical protein